MTEAVRNRKVRSWSALKVWLLAVKRFDDRLRDAVLRVGVTAALESLSSNALRRRRQQPHEKNDEHEGKCDNTSTSLHCYYLQKGKLSGTVPGAAAE